MNLTNFARTKNAQTLGIAFLILVMILHTGGQKLKAQENATAQQYLQGADYYIQQNEFQKAIQYIFLALKKDPVLPNAWTKLGYCYESTGQKDSAISAYRKALEQSSSDSYAGQRLAALDPPPALPGMEKKMVSRSQKNQVNKWEQSWRAGSKDANGKYLGGSQLMHLVRHKGSLYASISYWMDSTSPPYGGSDWYRGSAQILRLDSKDGAWEEDFKLLYKVRPEILKQVIFTTDEYGKTLAAPVTLLITASEGMCSGDKCAFSFTRDDATGLWEGSQIFVYTGPPFKGTDNWSIRDVQVYQDKVTGVDMIFVLTGRLGIYSGVYDPAAPGKIRWAEKPENGPQPIRSLGIDIANGSLVYSEGGLIWERIDGKKPSYKIVLDISSLSKKINPPVGGIRGLTTVPNPKGPGDSLLFVWTPGPNPSPGEVYRADPDGSGGYTKTLEATLTDVFSKYLRTKYGGNNVWFVLGPYNRLMPTTLFSGGPTEYIIGFEAVIQKDPGDVPYSQSNIDPLTKPKIGYFRGGAFAVRNADGTAYRIEEINGSVKQSDPILQSVVSYEHSPFPDEEAIYFSGLDPNHVDSTNMAWIYKYVFFRE